MTRGALWVATSTSTRGGVATYVRTMQATPLWERWSVRLLVTHEDGTTLRKALLFVRAAAWYVVRLTFHPPVLVHVHMASRGSFVRKQALVWLARARRVPVVLHLHGAAFEDFHDRSAAPLRGHIRRTLEVADVVVALGPTWAERLRRIAPRARVAVVPNAVVPGTAVRPAAGRPVGVLFLGQVDDGKGAGVLLEAFARLVARTGVDAARLTVAGAGETEALGRRAADLGVDALVDVLGWVSPDRVPALIERAGVLALPSREEGQPMAILEAMARGLAVVATPVGGVPDLLGDTAGLLVPPDDVEALTDALVAVVADPALRDELGAGGLRRVREHFDVEETWRRLDTLYEELAR